MNVSYYDVLGVPHDASATQIKAAWRQAAERFDPGSAGSQGQFRLFNDAAEVLLDPERRKEYDAELVRQASRDDAPPAADDPLPEAAGASGEVLRTDDTAPAGTHRPALSVVVGLGATFLVLVIVAAWGVGVPGMGIPAWQTVQKHEQVVAVATSAPAAAERASAVILSYDYKTLAADKKAAIRFMTPAYAKEYSGTFELVLESAPKLKAQVAAKVMASGLANAGENRASVLVFVDQTTHSTANDGEPQTALNRVRMDMVKRDGAWLVDDITSY